MAYKVIQTGDRIQNVLDDVEGKLEVATQAKNGYMSAPDKQKLDELENTERIKTYEIDQIWETVTI